MKTSCHRRRPFVLCAVLFAVTFLWGCSLGPVHFKRSLNVSQVFERYKVLENHDYYYYGRQYKPLAVVAIQNGYQLNSPKWNRIDVTSEQLKDWIGRMLNQSGAEYNMEPNGAHIMDQNGEKIGLWYSVWALPVLVFESEMASRISDPVTRFPRTNRDPERGLFPFGIH